MDPQEGLSQTWVGIKSSTLCAEIIIICICSFIWQATPTILSLALLKRVNHSLKVNHPSFNYGSSSWYNMTCILEFLDLNSLIQTYGYAAVLLTTVENISSNITWYCGEIEPFNKFRTNLICVECILLKPILTHIRLLRCHLWIFNPGFCKVGYKTHVVQPHTWQLLKIFWQWLKLWPWSYLSIRYSRLHIRDPNVDPYSMDLFTLFKDHCTMCHQ